MSDRKVLITGGAGYIASQLLTTFRGRYEVVLLDARAEDRQGRPVEGVHVVDLIDADRDKYAAHFEGVDAVVHLGYKRRVGEALDHFLAESENVDMAYNVLRCAYDAGVRRVAVASSNHAADWYESALIHKRKLDMLDPYRLPLSDNFYGWAKATYEHMGFLFACGAFGRKMGVVNVRIGAPRELKLGDFGGDAGQFKRNLGAYISARDLTQLFTKAIEVEDIDDEHGVPWHIVYGISNNTRAFWSLSNARRVLGYEPEDDSEVKYADDIRGFLVGDGATAGPGRVG
jgi:nucleoside-diphosphate-sugar epimerase